MQTHHQKGCLNSGLRSDTTTSHWSSLLQSNSVMYNWASRFCSRSTRHLSRSSISHSNRTTGSQSSDSSHCRWSWSSWLACVRFFRWGRRSTLWLPQQLYLWKNSWSRCRLRRSFLRQNPRSECDLNKDSYCSSPTSYRLNRLKHIHHKNL